MFYFRGPLLPGAITKGNTLRKLLGALCAVTIGLAALTACELPEEDTSNGTTATQKEQPAGDTAGKPAKPNKALPDNSSKGKGALTWGNWQVVGQLQVSADGLDQFDVVTRVKNISDSPDEGLFTVTVLKGDEILATANCSTSTVAPGSVGLADCISMDDFVPGWTEVTIENAF